MNTKMDGKEILHICLSDGRDHTASPFVTADKAIRMKLSATYHGDHDEFWVVVYQRAGGDEIQRYNCKNVASITWAEGEGES